MMRLRHPAHRQRCICYQAFNLPAKLSNDVMKSTGPQANVCKVDDCEAMCPNLVQKVFAPISVRPDDRNKTWIVRVRHGKKYGVPIFRTLHYPTLKSSAMTPEEATVRLSGPTISPQQLIRKKPSSNAFSTVPQLINAQLIAG